MMIEKLKNIDNAFFEVRRISIVAICACVLVCIIAQAYHYAEIKRLQEQIYVLAEGKVIQAYASTRAANISVEAKDHISSFHEYFFSLDPNGMQIHENIIRALYLADNSAKEAFDDLSEQGYYTHLLNSNSRQRITNDSIVLDLNQSPYGFWYYATQKLISPSSKVTRNLITEGKLRTISRSERNPHGFLIENWKIIENKELNTESQPIKIAP